MSGEKNRIQGALAEEALRHYFLSSGYFVVRNVPFRYAGYDISDIDLFIYSKSSSFTRERINVDVKQRKTPQAIERIFWAKGLQDILGFDRCIVATSDQRRETRQFGENHNVIVLDGNFLERVIDKYKTENTYLNEEELLATLGAKSSLPPHRLWRQFYSEQKELLLSGMTYDGVNSLLNRLRFPLHEVSIDPSNSNQILRIFYISMSYWLLALDHVSSNIANLDAKTRRDDLVEGFRFGNGGKRRADEVIDAAIKLLASAGHSDLFTREALEKEFRQQLALYPAESLAEFFGKSELQREMFNSARELHSLAFNKELILIRDLAPALKSCIAVCIDFFQMDRKRLL